jgi:DNA-binding winged helix-turn-helix (wHTH) protein/pimeloyl-ACP methyl ester carboxylesterase
MVYGFGSFRLDTRERQLFSGGKPITLPPKVFDTLLVLVENNGHILTKEELMQQVWPDSFVEENNLAQNISALRRVLGETADLKFIETVPKRGYRFTSQVQILEEERQVVIRERARATIVIEEDDGEEEPFVKQVGGNFALPSFTQPAIETTAREVKLLEFQKPETHYVLCNDANIAYQTIGSGDIDLVFVMGWVSHLEYFWEEPSFASFLNRLASFSRLILFDKRGTGLSDRVPLSGLPTLEQRMEDVHAVMDAVGSERAVLMGVSEGGPMCSLFAATYPERTSALIMIGTYAKRIRSEDYPWAPTAEQREKFFELMQREWGGPVGIEERAPTMANDEAFRKWWSTYLRMGASPGAAVALTKMNAEIDVRHVLPSVRVPSLVIHRKGDMCLKVEEGRYVASLIPGCKYVELPGVDHLPFVGNQNEILDEVESFLTGVRYPDEYDRVLATVLSVRLIKPEDERELEIWSITIDNSQRYVRKQIELFKGRAVDYDGEGLLATFDGPARAIRCACALADAAGRLEIKVKVGLHTGECDVMDSKVGGVAVEISNAVAREAEVGEVLVSRTVKDLVAGSGLRFNERGVYTFSEALGEWRLFTVER